jgi:hypothetical protein
MKHTPGPWRAFNHSWEYTSILAPNFDHAVARLDISHTTEEAQESDEALMAANAHLIAAAPELLEALRSMLEDDDHDEAKRKARAALAKVEGGSNG